MMIQWNTSLIVWCMMMQSLLNNTHALVISQRIIWKHKSIKWPEWRSLNCMTSQNDPPPWVYVYFTSSCCNHWTYHFISWKSASNIEPKYFWFYIIKIGLKLHIYTLFAFKKVLTPRHIDFSYLTSILTPLPWC